MTLHCISGIDRQILSECSAKTKMLFGFATAFILMFVIACGFSCYYFVRFITPIVPLLVIVSAVFAYMIANLYVFNYSNISWRFSIVNSISKVEKPAVSASIIRLVFICFILMLISKPIEMFLFRNGINNEVIIKKKNDLIEVEKYAQTEYESTISSFTSQKLALDRQLDSINFSLRTASAFDYTYLFKSKNNITKKIADLRDTYDELLSKAENTREQKLKQGKKDSDDNTYLAARILILHMKYPQTWLITVIFCIYFLLPIIWRCFIRTGNEEYETIKSAIINRSIKDDYYEFKTQYEKEFKERGVAVMFPEKYLDPPFNTKLKMPAEVILPKGNIFDHINNSKKELDVIN
jgi:hypothetical protein